MILLLSALGLAAAVGYLAQSIGLCMVRGVHESIKGKPEFLSAILLSGTTAWIAVFVGQSVGLPLPFRAVSADSWIAVGGLLFGLGSALNQGCGVSTLNRLSRGQLQMSATLLGWILGWCALAHWPPPYEPAELGSPSPLSYGVHAALSLGLGVWALRSHNARRKLWFSMMGIGLLAGFLFLFNSSWPPSGFLRNLSAALLHQDELRWPAPTDYALLLALLGGMVFAAWKTRQFQLQLPKLQAWLAHLVAGVLMGVGAALALGGNDSQLLLALPALSPAGVVAVIAMLVGIGLGLDLRRRLFRD
ncbi:hypothetical protein DV711_08455 [Motiliproteus coralliicola]|uniref:YeeE/YedE family protein n=1 Tax=Motiliproteus coralliicola TaxID=2283196 RepID=A0A369WNG7_9GAMM|nr:YeeE/YedE thiosulfate transporter family protein [Motiliproteus coralliicola]RDE22609.1 hypothetical protein DV711_08455 [Motiliproteus coralliicola]